VISHSPGSGASPQLDDDIAFSFRGVAPSFEVAGERFEERGEAGRNHPYVLDVTIALEHLGVHDDRHLTGSAPAPEQLDGDLQREDRLGLVSALDVVDSGGRLTRLGRFVEVCDRLATTHDLDEEGGQLL